MIYYELQIEALDFLTDGVKIPLATIRAYFDESGTHKGARCPSVAYFAGTKDQWQGFLDEWQPRLVASGIPYFHAKDPRCDCLRSHLVQAITNSSLTGVVCSVFLDDFKKSLGQKAQSILGNAYSVCAFTCAMELCKWVKENSFKSVALALEDGQPNANFVKDTLLKIMCDPEEPISHVSLEKKDGCIFLQPADFLSHICSTQDVEWLECLFNTGNVTHAHFGTEQISQASMEIEKLIVKQRSMRRSAKKIGY
jgi:hypothetical protein